MSGRFRSNLILALPAAAGLLVLCIAAYLADFDGSKWIEQVLMSLVSGVTATFLALLFGLKQIERILAIHSRRNTYREVAEFWQTGAHSKRFFILFGGRGAVNNSDIEIRLQFATAYSFAIISGMLHELFEGAARIEFLPAHTFDDASLLKLIQSDNVVILGGDLSVPFTDQVLKALGAPYRQDCKASPREIHRIQSGMRSEAHYSQAKEKSIGKDVALVTRIIDHRTRNLLVFVSGNYGVGTIGGAIAVTAPKQFPAAGFDSEAGGQQCIVEITGVQSDNLVHRDKAVVKATKWTAFDVRPLEELLK
jgi:hypothetical protein